MNADAARDRPTVGGIALFALLFAIGLCYLASLGYFFRNGSNFVQRDGIAAARAAVADERPALPASYAFNLDSSWTKSLAYGWNRPESWGVWADNPSAAIVLPPLPAGAARPVCLHARIGNSSKRHRWTMRIIVDDNPLGGPAHYTGAGPFELSGMVRVTPGEPIVIRFSGPLPLIPRATSRHNMDSRLLSFSLFGITVAPNCQQP